MDLKEKLIALSEQKDIEKYYSEELGEDVFYIKLSTKDGTMLSKIINTQSDDNIVAKVLIKSLCTEDGELILKASDIEYINRLPLAFTSELFKRILLFNKMIADEEGKSPEEEAVKN